MFKKQYARWMYDWETRLTTRDENRVVRPLEWGFEWIEPFLREHGFKETLPGSEVAGNDAAAEATMVRVNQLREAHRLPTRSAAPATISHQCTAGDAGQRRRHEAAGR
jgi:hypothetical protein